MAFKSFSIWANIGFAVALFIVLMALKNMASDMAGALHFMGG